MWWVEITDVIGQGFWATWPMDDRVLKDSPTPLHAVMEEDSPVLRAAYEKEEAERKVLEFRTHPKIQEVQLVQVSLRQRGYEPLWDSDRERLGW